MDLIGEKIYHDRRNKLAVQEREYVRLRQTNKTYTEVYNNLTHNRLSRTVSCCHALGTKASMLAVPLS